MLHADYFGQQFGDYRLLRKIGGGGFGDVYQAENVHDQSMAAVKVLHSRLHESEDLKLFINEARSFRLKHPNILPLLDFGIGRNDIPFFVMEYAPNGTLRARHPKGSQVPLTTIIEYALPIASALQYAHDRRLVHRDVKPENMLIGSNNEILLSDFGVTAVAHSSHSFGTEESVGGTLPYMAPEQIEGKARAASDQYALAIVVYEWLCGNRPFNGTMMEIAVQQSLALPPSLCNQLASISPGTEEIVLKALAKDPKARFASVQLFAQALQIESQRTLQTSPVELTAPSTPVFVSPPALPAVSPPLVLRNQTDEVFGVQVPTLLQVGAEDSQVPTPHKPPQTTPPPLITTMSNSGKHIGNGSAAFVREGRVRRKGIIALVILLLVILLVSTSVVFFVQRQNRSNQQTAATATALARIRISPTHVETTTPTIATYDTYVKEHGIMAGFDALHSHFNPYEHQLAPTNVGNLTLAWVATTGNVITSSPVVSNGVVYVGSSNGDLYAFATDCKKTPCVPLWTAHTGSFLVASASVVHGVVYIGAGDSKLYAFKADGCGQTICGPLWAGQAQGALRSSPVIANNVVYIGSLDDKLYAFRADGCGQTICEPLWTARTNGQLYSTPAVDSNIVYVGSEDGNLYAFKADGCGLAECEALWIAKTEKGIGSSPTVGNGVVYIGAEDQNFYAFKAAGCGQSVCSALWIGKTDNSITSSPALADNIVYIGTNNHRLYAFQADGCGQSTCMPLWIGQTGDKIGSSPFVANGVVYVGSFDGSLYAFTAKGCAQTLCVPLWKSQKNGSIYSSPTVVNGVVYVGSNDHNLYAYHL